MTILAFDLETVPDTDAGRRAFGLTGTDEDVAAAMVARRLEETKHRTDFLKPAFHRVVALGLATAHRPTNVPVATVTGWAGEDEAAVLQQFLDALGARPQLVSWNGNGFDLPVIRYRSLLYGLDTSALYGPMMQKQWDSYGYRYGEAHVDLMDVLAGYGASPTLTLHEAARLCGFPGKVGVGGDQVAALVAAGSWSRIEWYVQSDALQTLLLFLRFEDGRRRGPWAATIGGLLQELDHLHQALV